MIQHQINAEEHSDHAILTYYDDDGVKHIDKISLALLNHIRANIRMHGYPRPAAQVIQEARTVEHKLQNVIDSLNHVIEEYSEKKEVVEKTPRIVAFISGHRNIEESDFNSFYKPLIDAAHNSGHAFVVGDYWGADEMAIKYLKEIGAEDVTVYHMFDSPRADPSGFKVQSCYVSDWDRDFAMTRHSDYDIAWVGPNGWMSGTHENILRRSGFKNIDGKLVKLKSLYVSHDSTGKAIFDLVE